MRNLAAALLLFVSASTQAYAEPTTEAVYGEGNSYQATVQGKPLHYTTHQQQGDDLILTSGGLVVSDAFYIFDMQPLEHVLEPGVYPTTLTLTKDNEGDVRVASARVDIAPGDPVRWEPASSITVQSGTAAFLDEDTVQNAMSNYDPYGSAVLGALTYAVQHDEYWSAVTVDQDSGAGAVIFTAGYGDGTYTTYWGFDQNDQPVTLVADFNVLAP